MKAGAKSEGAYILRRRWEGSVLVCIARLPCGCRAGGGVAGVQVEVGRW